MGPPGGVCSAHGKHTYKARAGHHLTPQPLSSGRNVFEELGSGFHAAGVRRAGRSRRAFEEAARARNVPLKVVRDIIRDRPFRIRGAAHARPSGPVCGVDRRPRAGHSKSADRPGRGPRLAAKMGWGRGLPVAPQWSALLECAGHVIAHARQRFICAPQLDDLFVDVIGPRHALDCRRPSSDAWSTQTPAARARRAFALPRPRA